MPDTLRAARDVVFALVAIAGAQPCFPQTADPIFRSWRWTEEVTAPRALGLGGAVVGLADDGVAAIYNPAGLATIPRAGEFQIGYRLRSRTTLANEDRIRYRTKINNPWTFALRLGTRVGISYHLMTLRSATGIDFDDGQRAGTLRTSVNGPGAGVGVRVSPFLSFGLSLSALRFYINEGQYSETTTGGPSPLRVRFTSTGDTRVTGTLGALVKAREMSYGLTFRLGRKWRGDRRATNLATGIVIDDGSHFGVHSPSVISVGAAWQPEKVRRAGTFVLTGQVDRVLLSDVTVTGVPGLRFPGNAYKVRDTWELHAGSEVTFPFFPTLASHCRGVCPNRFQIRAGWHRQGAGSLEFLGADPAERALFPRGGYRHLKAIGASLGGTTIWRLSSAYRFGGPGPFLGGESKLWVFSLTFRYPGLFP